MLTDCITSKSHRLTQGSDFQNVSSLSVLFHVHDLDADKSIFTNYGQKNFFFLFFFARQKKTKKVSITKII